jgi:hypothetical protein
MRQQHLAKAAVLRRFRLHTLVPIADASIPVALALSWIGLMWKLPYTVSIDSPSHLYTSHVATELLFRPGSHYSKFYELNSAYLPNWGTTFFLSFLNLFLPYLGAERMLKTILPLLFGFVVYRVLQRRSSHPLILIPLFYPLIFSSFFSAGFYGFYIGILLCICLLCFLLPRTADVSVGEAILFSVLLIATYYSHLFALSSAWFSFCVRSPLIPCSMRKELLQPHQILGGE